MISLLFVDDDIPLLEVFKLSMEETGDFIVDISSSAEAALERLVHTRYDAIVADYLMPEMDALEFLKIIRGKGDDTPFILFTGKGREEVAIDAFEGGADFYVQKGSDPESQFTRVEGKIHQAIERRRSDKLLRESEERFRSFFEQNCAGCSITTPDGNWLSVNKRLCTMTGYTRSELLTTTWMDLIAPEGRSDEQKLFSAAINGKREGFERIQKGIRKDGSRFDALISTRPIHQPDGSIRSFSSIIHDITQQMKAEEDILHRDRLLGVVAESTRILLESHDPVASLPDILDLIGPVSGQDRVYYGEAVQDPGAGTWQISPRFEWVRLEPGSGFIPAGLQTISLSTEAPGIADHLQKGEIVYSAVSDLPVSDQKPWSGTGITSIILVPILVDRMFWGVIGLDNMQERYAWKDSEKEALAAITRAVGSAISRAKSEQKIREANEYLEKIAKNPSIFFHRYDIGPSKNDVKR